MEPCLGRFNPYIIPYNKGEIPTSQLVPTGLKVGEGASGIVYLHKNNSKQVVKKSNFSLENEFFIGKMLRHASLVTMHQLFIKNVDKSKTYKLVMDKVEGTRLYEVKNISAQLLTQLMKDLKNCCLYLFDKNVVWGDLGMYNAFISQEERLVLIDYGSWKNLTCSIKKTYDLIENVKGLIYQLFIKAKLTEIFNSIFDDEEKNLLKNFSALEGQIFLQKKFNQKEKQFLTTYFDHFIETIPS